VGLAFDYFKTQAVDFAVIETGLGGRLDSTNVIRPLISVITNIGLDHTQFLGNTPELIAAEKAGIIKNKVPVVIGEYSEQTKAVFEKAKNEQAPIFFASDLVNEDYASDLLGDYQVYITKRR
jgi:dihydrofolate synthase/folylpolyglutamate synthase